MRPSIEDANWFDSVYQEQLEHFEHKTHKTKRVFRVFAGVDHRGIRKGASVEPAHDVNDACLPRKLSQAAFFGCRF
jgi:hypothetical protein